MTAALATLILASPVEAQVRREREATVTGPRGRTIERRLEVERGPGYYQRELQIQRPGGTIERGVTIQRPAPGFAGGFGPRPGGWFGPPPPPAPRSSSVFSFGLMAAPVVAAPLWPPAPVVVAPPVVVAQPGAVVVPHPRLQPAVVQPSPLDPVALAAQRLQSHHAASRRDGAQTLGRLGDPRGVPPLVDALKNDSSRDVRIAAATALGQIGGTESATVLERCIIYEKKEDVRDAATAALACLRKREQEMATAVTEAPGRRVRTTPRESEGVTSEVPRLSPWVPSSRANRAGATTSAASSEPALEGPVPEEDDTWTRDRTPPPPPTPVGPG